MVTGFAFHLDVGHMVLVIIIMMMMMIIIIIIIMMMMMMLMKKEGSITAKSTCLITQMHDDGSYSIG